MSFLRRRVWQIVAAAVALGTLGVVVGLSVQSPNVLQTLLPIALGAAATCVGAVFGVRTPPQRRSRSACVRTSMAVGLAARLLPRAVRNEHCEEWAAWLADMWADGTPWWRRLLEVLSIVLVAVPRLAVALRLARGRAVD